MESSKDGWWIIAFKKFSRLRVKYEYFIFLRNKDKGTKLYISEKKIVIRISQQLFAIIIIKGIDIPIYYKWQGTKQFFVYRQANNVWYYNEVRTYQYGVPMKDFLLHIVTVIWADTPKSAEICKLTSYKYLHLLHLKTDPNELQLSL